MSKKISMCNNMCVYEKANQDEKSASIENFDHHIRRKAKSEAVKERSSQD